MALERKTVVDSVTIDRHGNINVKLGLLIVEDGEEVSCTWHRCAAGIDEDIEDVLAEVNGDLTHRGIPAVDYIGAETLRVAKSMRGNIEAFKAAAEAVPEELAAPVKK